MSCRRTLVSATLGLAVVVGGTWLPAATAHAADRDRHCAERVERARARLDRAIERHGERSRQAERARYKLHELQERCEHEHHDFH